MFAKIITNVMPWVYNRGRGYYEKYNGYGEHAYNYSYGHNPEADLMWFGLIIWFFLTAFAIWFLYTYWDEIVGYYYKWHERGKVKSVTIDVSGHVSNIEKLEQLTEDVNTILAGQKLPQISRAHKLNANNIIGISVMPGKSSLLYTIWYR